MPGTQFTIQRTSKGAVALGLCLAIGLTAAPKKRKSRRSKRSKGNTTKSVLRAKGYEYLSNLVLPYDSHYALGDSYNINLGPEENRDGLGTDTALASDNSSAAIQINKLTSDISLVESTEQLRSRMETSVSASYRKGFVSANASAEYLKTVALDKYSLGVHARTVLEASNTHLSNRPELSSAALEVLERDPAEFFADYGTHFVLGLARAAEFHGNLKLTTKSRADRERIAGKFSGGNLAVSVSGDFERDVKESSKSRNLTIDTLWVGGTDIENPTSVNGLFSTWRSSPSKLERNVPPKYMLLAPYTALRAVKNRIANLSARTERYSASDNAVRVFEEIVKNNVLYARMIADVNEVIADIAHSEARHRTFRQFGSARLFRSQMESLLTTIENDQDRLLVASQKFLRGTFSDRTVTEYAHLGVKTAAETAFRVYLPPRYLGDASRSSFVPRLKGGMYPLGKTSNFIHNPGISNVTAEARIWMKYRPYTDGSFSSELPSKELYLRRTVDVTVRALGGSAVQGTFQKKFNSPVFTAPAGTLIQSANLVFEEIHQSLSTTSMSRHKIFTGRSILRKAALHAEVSRSKINTGVRGWYYRPVPITLIHIEDHEAEPYYFVQHPFATRDPSQGQKKRGKKVISHAEYLRRTDKWRFPGGENSQGEETRAQPIEVFSRTRAHHRRLLN